MRGSHRVDYKGEPLRAGSLARQELGTIATVDEVDAALTAQDLSLYYGKFRAVRDVNLAIQRQRITAIIGPSGCGKSTILRSFNRMNDFIPGARAEGRDPVRRAGHPGADRRSRRPAPADRHGLPEAQSVPQVHLRQRRLGCPRQRLPGKLDELVETSLRQAALWEEVKDQLERRARCPLRAASSSACASPARWRSSRRSS